MNHFYLHSSSISVCHSWPQLMVGRKHLIWLEGWELASSVVEWIKKPITIESQLSHTDQWKRKTLKLTSISGGSRVKVQPEDMIDLTIDLCMSELITKGSKLTRTLAVEKWQCVRWKFPFLHSNGKTVRRRRGRRRWWWVRRRRGRKLCKTRTKSRSEVKSNNSQLVNRMCKCNHFKHQLRFTSSSND